MNCLLKKSVWIGLVWTALSIHAVSAQTLIDELEGVYIEPGHATYQECEGCEWVPVKYATDCLVIKKLTDKTANVYLRTIQSRGHRCYIDDGDVYTVHGKNALFFRDIEMPIEKKVDGIYLIKDRGRIKFDVKPQKIETMYMGCGTGASTEGLSFKLSSKSVPWKKRKIDIQSQVNLSQYCPAWNLPQRN